MVTREIEVVGGRTLDVEMSILNRIDKRGRRLVAQECKGGRRFGNPCERCSVGNLFRKAALLHSPEEMEEIKEIIQRNCCPPDKQLSVSNGPLLNVR